MRARVMLGDNIKMDTVQEAVNSLLEGIEGAGFKFYRTVPGKPFIVEFNVKDKSEHDRVYDRAIDRW